MDTDSFTVNIKTEDINVDIAKDVETRFDASIYELDKPLPKGKWKGKNAPSLKSVTHILQ